MTPIGPLKILSVDQDRLHQEPIAAAINQAGFQLRFLTDPAKTLAGLHQFRPHVLLHHAEVRAESTTQILTAMANDVSFASLPVILLCDEVGDAPFLNGLRTGIVALWQKPFSAREHLAELHTLLEDLPRRSGRVFGSGESVDLAQLVEHVRRTLRSGVITFNPHSPAEGRATFIKGKLESARFQSFSNVEALIKMVAQPQADWSFTEVGGAAGDGAGVVIEMDMVTEPVSTLEDEPLTSAPPPASLLLVDDDPTLSKLFCQFFGKNGFEVRAAHDGMDGYQQSIAVPVDVVIADLNMPRLDGWGMLRMMRDDARSREIPLAFLSCHDDYRDALQALNAGAQGYFSKGTRLEQMVKKVRELLAPRLHFRQLLAEARAAPLSVDGLGPLWTLRELSRNRFTGRLNARDGFATYLLTVVEGQPVHAQAQAGPHTAHGERAFTALIASRGLEGTVTPGLSAHPSPNLQGELEIQIARACATLNDNDRRMRDEVLVHASTLQVNRELYAVYARVGPRHRLGTARLICEQGLAPREVIAQTQASPLEVEETLKDLIRRGIVAVAP